MKLPNRAGSQRHIRVLVFAYAIAWGLTSFVCALCPGVVAYDAPRLILTMPYRGKGTQTIHYIMEVKIEEDSLPKDGEAIIFQLHKEISDGIWHEGIFDKSEGLIKGVGDEDIFPPHEMARWESTKKFTKYSVD